MRQNEKIYYGGDRYLTDLGLTETNYPHLNTVFLGDKSEAPLYADQEPTIEAINTGSGVKTVLTFHTGGKRYFMHEGEELKIFKKGKALDVTPEYIRTLKAAIDTSNDQRVKEFFHANIAFTQVLKQT